MSIEQVMMEIFCNVRLKRTVDARNGKYIAAQAVSYGEAFAELSEGKSQSVIDAVAKQLPETFLNNYTVNRSAIGIVSKLFDAAEACVVDLEAAIEAHQEANAEKIAEAKAKAEAAKVEAERIAQEAASAEAAAIAKAKADEAAKAAADKAQREADAKRLAEMSEADRQKAEAAKVEAETKEVELDSITQQQFDETPLKDVLSHQGAVNAYGKEGLSTVSDIEIFRQSRSLTAVRGIGVEREEETIEEIEAYRKRIK